MTTPALPIGGRCAFLRAKLAQKVAELRAANVVEKGAQLVKAGYLANPRTMLRITAGNVMMAGTETFVTRPLATTLDYALSVARSAATRFEVPASSFREFHLPSIAGIKFGAKGFQESLAKGIQVIRTGVDPEQIGEQFDVRRINYGSPAFNRAINGFFDFVGAAHGVWYGLAYNLSLFNAAETLAVKEGLSGVERATRVNALLAAPTDEMTMRAIQEAQYAAFRNKTALGDAVSKAKRSLRDAGTSKSEREATPQLAAAKRVTGKALYGASEVFAPFVQMPVAIAGVAVDYSPLGFVKAMVLQLPKETRSQGQLATRLARAGAGTAATFGLGYALAKAGKMTGSMPSSPGEKAEWDAEGKIPNAVKLNGRWYSLRAGEPITLSAILGANLYQAHVEHPQDTGLGSEAGQIVAYQGKSLSELPMLTGIRNVAEALQDPAKKGPALAAAAVPIPAISSQIAQGVDPTVRQTSGVADRLQSKIPFASTSLPERLDQFGRPLTHNEGGLVGMMQSAFDITQSQPDRSDVVTRELDRLRVFPGLPGKTVRIQKQPVTMSPTDYNKMMRSLGPETHEALAETINDPEYRSLSDEDRATVLKKIVTDMRQGAHNEYKGNRLPP